MEDIVASEWAELTGLKVRRVKARVSKSHTHARVNMDRQIIAVDPAQLHKLTADRDGFSPLASILLDPGPGYLECKTMNSWDFRKLQREGPTKHDHYIVQLQHGLAVTGYRWGVFAIMDSSTFEMEWFAMLRNDALGTELMERTEGFWSTFIDDPSHALPEALPDGDKRCVKCLHRRSCRGDAYLAKHAGADFATDYIESNDPELVELANDYLAAEEQADKAAEVLSAIKERVKARMIADETAKVNIPQLIRFCLSTSPGRRTWDSRAIEGEINALRKGELPKVDETLNITEVLAIIIPAIADRLAACQKTGAPSTSFRTFAA